MGKIIFQRKSILILGLLVILSVAWGCSTTVKQRQEGQPAGEATGPTTTGREETGKYYFDDVRVPEELNYDPDASLIYETPKFKAGVLRFSKWRLDVQSLIDYFMYNMGKDNWTFVNTFRGQETQLSFSKPDKTCTIRITGSWTGTTHVTIAVGPLGEKKM